MNLDGIQTASEFEKQEAESKAIAASKNEARKAMGFGEPPARWEVISNMSTAEEFHTLTDQELSEQLEINTRKLADKGNAQWWKKELKNRIHIIETEIASRGEK